MADEAPGGADEASFRSSKRRKIFRRRAGSDEDAGTGLDIHELCSAMPVPDAPLNKVGPPSAPYRESSPESASEDGLNVAEIIRRRKIGKVRRGGIEFSNMQNRGSHEGAIATSEALVPVEQEVSISETAAKRFAPQTGQVKDVLNKHMCVSPHSNRFSRLHSC